MSTKFRVLSAVEKHDAEGCQASFVCFALLTVDEFTVSGKLLLAQVGRYCCNPGVSLVRAQCMTSEDEHDTALPANIVWMMSPTGSKFALSRR
jgi:hypothetical protein